jgi:hypothetical protein
VEPNWGVLDFPLEARAYGGQTFLRRFQCPMYLHFPMLQKLEYR